jgi:uncharacterized membrane protein
MLRIACTIIVTAALLAACQPEPPLPPAPVPVAQPPVAPAEDPAADKEVLVATEPAGAKVILKGAEVGTTPMKLLVRGNTNVVLDKEGYVKQALMITPESEPNLVIQLVPAGEGAAEAEVAPAGPTATAKKGSGKKKAKAEDEAAGEPAGEAAEDKPAEAAAEDKPAEAAAVAPPPEAKPKKKTFTNMRQLKQALAKGEITQADFRYWQTVLKQKRAKEVEAAKADYKAGKITKLEYKQKVNAIKKKYEG